MLLLVELVVLCLTSSSVCVTGHMGVLQKILLVFIFSDRKPTTGPRTRNWLCIVAARVSVSR